MTRDLLFWTCVVFATLGSLNTILIISAIVCLLGPTGAQVLAVARVLLVAMSVDLSLWATAVNVMAR